MPGGRKVQVYQFDPESVGKDKVDKAIKDAGATAKDEVDEDDLEAYIASLDPSQGYASTYVQPIPPSGDEGEEEGEEPEEEGEETA